MNRKSKGASQGSGKGSKQKGQQGKDAPVGASTAVTQRKALTLSVDAEFQVKTLLQDLALDETTAEASSQGGILDAKQTARRYTAIFDSLLQHGFKQEQVQQALLALPRGRATLDTALDWLCLQFPREELPRRFAGGVRAGAAGAEVKVVAKAQARQKVAPNLTADWLPSSSSSSATSELDEEYCGHGGSSSSTAKPAATARAAEDEKEASKAWILQYMQAESDESDADSLGAEAGVAIDDWELWADPREVERRRAERARAKIPPEVRRRQVAHEYAKAKEHAAQAKAAGDKNKQKECGQIIRDLKLEMDKLGLPEAVAVAIVAEDTTAAAAAAAAPAATAPSAGPSLWGEGSTISLFDDAETSATEAKPAGAAGAAAAAAARDATSLPAGAVAAGAQHVNGAAGAELEPCGVLSSWEEQPTNVADHAAAIHAHAPKPSDNSSQPPSALVAGIVAGGAVQKGQVRSGQEEEEEAWEPPVDLFSGDLSEVPSSSQPVDTSPAGLVGAAKKAAAERPASLDPWGSYGSGAKGGKSKGLAPPPSRGKPTVKQVLQQPKALLSQHCQKQGWSQPRFERLPDLTGTGRYRYAVSIDMGPARGPAKKKGLFGVHSYQLFGDEDGWDTIQDAQNAAATRALFEVLSEQQPLHHSLASPFRELWLGWESQGDAYNKSVAEAAKQSKLEFVNALLSAPATSAADEDATAEAADAAAAKRGSVSAGEVLTRHGAHDSVEQEEWEEFGEEELSTAAAAAAAAAEVEELRPQAELTPHEAETSERLRNQLESWWASEQGREMHAKRDTLPITAIRDQLLEALSSGDVVVVCGDTGCGKTTQVPQYLLEHATLQGQGARCNIICTQPRRIAAISVAERVAVERGEPEPGSRGGSTVGYHVRLDAASTSETRLLFCTTGILLRRLAGDPALKAVSHVVVDEVHERSLQSDFLMALLWELVGRRRDMGLPLKVVLMSATLDAQLFAGYFGGCAVLIAQGRTFPVQHLFLEDVYQMTQYRLAPDAAAALRSQGSSALQRIKKQAGGGRDRQTLLSSGLGDEEAYAEGPLNPYYDPDLYHEYDDITRRNLGRVNEDMIDYDLLEALIGYIDSSCSEGAILVFMPGMGEISSLITRLSSTRHYSQGKHWLLPLHSATSPGDQRQAFRVPPAGVRKIVVATNIAETSLTIEDVVYVIDTGKHKERRYDAARHMSLLVEDWVSRANALQRKGRAGRVRPGQCYALCTKDRFEHRLRAFQLPEILRVPLEELVLQIHLMKLGPAAQFLARVLQPPAANAIRAALAALQEVGALTAEEQLTPLGHHLAQLPVDPHLGKLLVLGACFACLAPAATIAAAMSHKSPFAMGPDKKDEADRIRKALASPGAAGIAAGQQSDHLLLVAAMDLWLAARAQGGMKAAAQVARQHLLHSQTLEQLQEMRGQFATMLADVHFVHVPQPTSSRSSRDLAWLDDLKQPWNKYSRNPAVVKAVLCAALAPKIAAMSELSSPSSMPLWSTGVKESEEVVIHPSSICHNLITSKWLQPFVVFLEKVKTSKVFLRDVTPISPVALLLFGGPLRVLHGEGVVLVDDWVRVRAAAQTAVVVKKLRDALDRVLEEKIRNPSMDFMGKDAQVITTIVKLLQDDEKVSGS